jgi:hypothetical protein
MKLKSFLGIGLLFIFTTLLLMWPSLYNHFPLTNPDSGSYIHNGYINDLPKDRPVFYSWYIKWISREKSLWYVVLSQCLLLASLITAAIFRFFPKLHFALKSGSVILLSLCTSAGWFSGQLMPDIFTSIILLSILLFYATPHWSIKILLSVIIFASACLHNSSLINVSSFSLFLILLSVALKQYRSLLKPSLQLFSISLLSWIATCSLHYQYDYGFVPSRSGHIFLMGRMAENGILKKYLKEYCPTQNMKLCAYQDNIPDKAWDFIWNDDGAFAHSGGWDSSKSEYTKIIMGSLSKPEYLALHISEAIKGTVEEACLVTVGDGLLFDIETSNVIYKIEEHFPDKLQYLRDSKQAKDKLSFTTLNLIYQSFALLSIAITLIILFKNKTGNTRYLLSIVMLFILINAFTSCTFANVLPRLNARVFWVLPFFCTLIIFETLQGKLLKEKS